MKPRNVDQCTAECRCQCPNGSNGRLYLNAFCRFALMHKRLEDYGHPRDSRNVSAEQYHENWLAGRGLR